MGEPAPETARSARGAATSSDAEADLNTVEGCVRTHVLQRSGADVPAATELAQLAVHGRKGELRDLSYDDLLIGRSAALLLATWRASHFAGRKVVSRAFRWAKSHSRNARRILPKWKQPSRSFKRNRNVCRSDSMLQLRRRASCPCLISCHGQI